MVRFQSQSPRSIIFIVVVFLVLLTFTSFIKNIYKKDEYNSKPLFSTLIEIRHQIPILPET